MKILLHVCCGPCSISPVSILREENHSVTGLFFNPNIHPYKEFQRRLDTLQEYAKSIELPLIVDDRYLLDDFLTMIFASRRTRCENCYDFRLRQAAQVARQSGFDAFSTTLLVSPYQNHDMIIESAKRISKDEAIAFHYQDFRPAWQQGVAISRQLQMYRQPYCGCIFSERDRYYKLK